MKLCYFESKCLTNQSIVTLSALKYIQKKLWSRCDNYRNTMKLNISSCRRTELTLQNNQQIKYMKHKTGYYVDVRYIAIHSFLHEQLILYISHDMSVWNPSLIAASTENM